MKELKLREKNPLVVWRRTAPGTVGVDMMLSSRINE